MSYKVVVSTNLPTYLQPIQTEDTQQRRKEPMQTEGLKSRLHGNVAVATWKTHVQTVFA